jgi:phage terminase Nu1 subunit (DNA packaging protein)
MANARASATNADYTLEKTREAKAKADILEIERAERLGEMIKMDVAKTAIADALSPIAAALRDLPDRFAERAFPHDPAHGRRVLVEIQSDLVKRVNEGLGLKKKAVGAKKVRGKSVRNRIR